MNCCFKMQGEGKLFLIRRERLRLTPKHDIKWLVSLGDVPRSCRLCSEVVGIGHLVARPDYSWVVCPAETFVGVRACRLYFCQIICRHCNEREKENFIKTDSVANHHTTHSFNKQIIESFLTIKRLISQTSFPSPLFHSLSTRAVN